MENIQYEERKEEINGKEFDLQQDESTKKSLCTRRQRQQQWEAHDCLVLGQRLELQLRQQQLERQSCIVSGQRLVPLLQLAE